MVVGKFLRNPVFYLLLIVLVSLLTLNVRYPMVGCDYVQFVPRLLDGYLYYLKNGIAVQWWTPSFGGGLPSYANPQQIQFSIPQFLMFVMNPWLSINVTVVIFTVVGYYCLFFLVHKNLLFSKEQAILGATLFSVTGFYIEHLSTGHLTYITFPLITLLVILLTNHSLPIPIVITGIAFTFAYLIYSGSFYVMTIFIFSVPLTLLLIYTLSPPIKPDFLGVSLRALSGLILGILLSSSKLVAIASFMRFFPRHVNDVYEVSILKSLAGLIGQLFFTPIALFSKRLLIGNILRYFTGARYGLWELDIGLSPVIVIIFLSVFILRGNLSKTHILRQKIGFLLMIGVLAWISVELSIAKGYLYTSLKMLIIMRSLRGNVRFAAIFILPLIILSLYVYRVVHFQIQFKFLKKVNLSLLLALITIGVYSEYISMPIREGCIKFNISPSLHDWVDIRQFYNDYQVRYIAPIWESKVFRMRTSSTRPYDPIFTPPEMFAPKIKEGLVDENDGNFFNITNPASLMFPKENGLSLFERISLSDTDNFEKFITYRRSQWKLSTMQHVANIISLGTSIVMLVVLLGYFIKIRIRKKTS